ncbi:MAG TPA: adenylyltransferase/cytidyltransferase family protein, partial [Bacteroidales bacterium]|nr:adenylyltransferase/cytidyltransferase family protein [Bacteroidales bacterium]
MLHSGHVAFFEEAATHGDLYVGIGSDRTINDLKGRRTVNGERERLYMIKSLRFVKDAWINRGSGLLDFEEELREIRPDIFFVNEDGYTPDKKRLCDELGIELVVSRRVPVNGLPPRSTTALRSECRIPYRLDLAGGWLDQPYVSKFWPGAVLTISIEPDLEFNDRSGMSSSTRR